MATRFYLPSSAAAAISPTEDAAWDVNTTLSRMKCSPTKVGDAMTSFSFDDSNLTNRDVIRAQFISDPIEAQTIAAQTLEFQARFLESDALNNMFAALCVRVLSNDGTTVRGTILALTRGATEFATSLTNRRMTATTTSVTSQNGDRIAIEIGAGGDPSTLSPGHDFTVRLGDAAASDLPEDETSTSDFNPWVEFPNTITFQSPDATMAGALATASTIAPAATLLAISAYGLALRATSGLLSHWDFHGDRLKDKISTNDLTATGSPTYNTGQVDASAANIETDDWYKAGDVAAFELQNGSVEAIFKADDVTTEGYIVSKEASGFTGWDLRVHSGSVKFRIGGGGAHHEVTEPISVSTWYHVVATWDNGVESKLYVNSVDAGTGTMPATVAYGTEQFAIGVGDYGGSNVGPFNGLIDDVAIYDRVLTPTEVANHAAATGLDVVNATLVAALTTASTISPDAVLGSIANLLAEATIATALSPNSSISSDSLVIIALATATASSPNITVSTSTVLLASLAIATARSPEIAVPITRKVIHNAVALLKDNPHNGRGVLNPIPNRGKGIYKWP